MYKVVSYCKYMYKFAKRTDFWETAKSSISLTVETFSAI